MSSSPGIPVNVSHRLPTQENLSELLEKLLTVFGVESILEGRALPSQPLQREIGDIPRYVLPPIAGNDFHVQPSFGSSLSWKALMQFDRDGEKVSLPFCDVVQHPKPEDATATPSVQQMAALLRSVWPDADVVGPSKRHQLGPPFVDPDLPDYHLFRWLASKDLNPVREGIFLIDLYQFDGFLHQPVRQVARGLAFRPSPSEADREPISVDRRPNAKLSDAQIWSFTGPDNWVISLPVVATILLLMEHPTKEANNPLSDNPDRDLSWTLDSLHGFCRQEGLEEGNRPLSWSLGTFADHWMYLNFIFYYFTPHDITEADEHIGSGIRCDRRTVTVPLGGPNGKVGFRERRVWFSMRTATAFRGYAARKLKGPATIGFVLADMSHHTPNRMTKEHWSECRMEPAENSSGITAFQMLLWGGVDEWSRGWNACLDYVGRLYEVQVEDIDGSDPDKLHDLMFDPRGWLAKEYFVAAHLLKVFGRHIDVLPRSLEQMRSKWEGTYPGVDADPLRVRFNHRTELALLRNWLRLMAHAYSLHGKLVHRIEKMSAEFLSRRNNVSITDPVDRHTTTDSEVEKGHAMLLTISQLMIARGR